jgi:hypothetical protein
MPGTIAIAKSLKMELFNMLDSTIFFTGYEASPLADYLDIDPAIQCSELENHHVNIC